MNNNHVIYEFDGFVSKDARQIRRKIKAHKQPFYGIVTIWTSKGKKYMHQDEFLTFSNNPFDFITHYQKRIERLELLERKLGQNYTSH